MKVLGQTYHGSGQYVRLVELEDGTYGLQFLGAHWENEAIKEHDGSNFWSYVEHYISIHARNLYERYEPVKKDEREELFKFAKSLGR